MVVVPLIVKLPPTVKSDPTYNFFSIAAPPATVKEPPFVLLVASVDLLIPTPPDTTIAPVELLVESVVLVLVNIPELLIVVAPDIPPDNAKLDKVPTEVILGWAADADCKTPVIAVVLSDLPTEVTPAKVVTLGCAPAAKVPVNTVELFWPTDVAPVNVVILFWAPADKVPVKVVADTVVAVSVLTPEIVPVDVKFLIPERSLLLSTTNALLAVTVPAVTPTVVFNSAADAVTLANLFKSAAVAVTNVPANLNPVVVPLCCATSTFPLEVKPVKVPTEVTLGWDAVDKAPAKVVAVNVVTPDIVPVVVKFLIPDKSLLVSTTRALLADTVPPVTLVNLFKSTAVAVTNVPCNFNPWVLPSCCAISTLPLDVKPVNVPTDVTLDCEEVDNAPVNVVADTVPVDVKFLIPVKSLLISTTKALLADVVPLVIPVNLFKSEATAVTKVPANLNPWVLPSCCTTSTLPLEDNPVKVPTDVTLDCEAVDNVPVNVAAVIVPVEVKLPMPVKFLLESTNNTLLADTTPAVIPLVGSLPDIDVVISTPFTKIAAASKVPTLIWLVTVKPDNVPTDVILGWAAVAKVPVKVVADIPTAPVMEPVVVIFLIPDKSLLPSTTNALLILTVPGVTPATLFNSAVLAVNPDNLFISLAVAVTKVPANFNPWVLPSCDATFTLPLEVKLVNVPTDVTLDWAADCKVPVNVVADEAPTEVTPAKVVTLGWDAVDKAPAKVAAVTVPVDVKLPMPVKFLLESTNNTLLADTVPGVTPEDISLAAINAEISEPLTSKLPALIWLVTVKAPKVPTVVILGWLAVCKVPVTLVPVTLVADKLVAVKFLILDISLFTSTTKALAAWAVPAVAISV